MARGHDVRIFCARADSPPADLDVTVLPARALTNHGRNARFSAQLSRHVATGFDAVIGFNALEDLDALYCADAPVRARGAMTLFDLRKRAFLALERACFGPDSRTRLLLLSDAQRADYDRRWHLDPERIALVPPTIERNRVVPQENRAALRKTTRDQLQIAPDDSVWLFVGSFPQTKGLDRLIEALPHCPQVRVLCVGPAPREAAPFRARAEHRGVATRIAWLGVRDDIPALMVASDLLVHPSRLDITGTVILEAIANGLPVITTSVCGYAPHVAAADAGRVVAEPFSQQAFVAALRDAQTSLRQGWAGRADAYAASHDLTSGLDVAADWIASLPAHRAGLRGS